MHHRIIAPGAVGEAENGVHGRLSGRPVAVTVAWPKRVERCAAAALHPIIALHLPMQVEALIEKRLLFDESQSTNPL